MKILVNTITTKKHSGGAFQIAYNFLSKTLECPEIDWIYVVSQDLDDILPDKLKNGNYHVYPTQPNMIRSYLRVKNQLIKLENEEQPDVVYSITAPSYFTFNAPEVMRFTNPWVTHPNKYAWSVLSLKEKLYYYLYGQNQKRMMKKAQYFITQTETCAKGILRITKVPKDHVKVVSNVLPAVFMTLNKTPVVEKEFINVACVGAATTHKNFDILPYVLKELCNLGFNNVRIHITLPNDEPTLGVIDKNAEKCKVSHMIVNHGRLSQKELGELYRRCQFCFLPTLLEVFSASTLEAMYYQLPVVATDFQFNKDVLGDTALYYKPKDAKAAAKQFDVLFKDKNLQNKIKTKMQNQMALYNDYDAHFKSIVDFLKKVASEA